MKKKFLLTVVGLVVSFLPQVSLAEEITCATNLAAEVFDAMSINEDTGEYHDAYQGFQVEEQCQVLLVGVRAYYSGAPTQGVQVQLIDITNDETLATAADVQPELWPNAYDGAFEWIDADEWEDPMPILEPGVQYALHFSVTETATDAGYGFVYDEFFGDYGALGFGCYECDQVSGTLIFEISGETVGGEQVGTSTPLLSDPHPETVVFYGMVLFLAVFSIIIFYFRDL